MRALLVLLLLVGCERQPVTPEVCQLWCNRYRPQHVIVMEDGRCACVVDPLSLAGEMPVPDGGPTP